MKTTTFRATAIALLLFAAACSEPPAAPDAVSLPDSRQQVTGQPDTEALLIDIVRRIFEPGERELPESLVHLIKDLATAGDFEGAVVAANELIHLARAEIEPGEEDLFEDLLDVLTICFAEFGYDAGFGVIGTNGGTVTTNLAEAGIEVPAGGVTETTIFIITQLPGGCLNTDLPQSAQCYRYTAIPNMPFQLPATLGECIDPAFVKPGQEGLLRLGAQDIDPSTGMTRVVTLPPVAEADLTFLSCPPATLSLSGQPRGIYSLASYGWHTLKDGLSTVFLPTPLEADAVVLAASRGVGGKKGSLTDVAALLPAQMRKVAGDDQTGLPGSAVSVDPTVLVTDADDNPVEGAQVHFQLISGGGSVTPATSYSDVNGFAKVDAWILGGLGTNVLEASGKGIADPADPAESWSGGPFADDEVVVDHTTGRLQFTASVSVTDGWDVIVINDVDIFDQTGTTNPNNRTLISNLVGYFNTARGSETTVWFDRGRSSKCYDKGGCRNQDLTTMTGIITTAGLSLVDNNTSGRNRYKSIPSDVKIIFLWNPTVSFRKGEISAFNTFLDEGGRLILVSEEKDFVGANGIRAANRLLKDLGASSRVNGDNVDCAPTVLPASSINASHPIMNGITGLTMDCAASMTMSTADAARLFTTSNNRKVIGAEALDLRP